MVEVALPSAFALILSSVGAYVAMTKAQANHETRITTIEKQQEQAAPAMQSAVEKSEQRINQRLDQIQTDVREIRNAQIEMLREQRLK